MLIIGAGIAGASAAYFARQAGREPTVIDAGIEAASSLPVALINPLRGLEGRLVKRGEEGARTSFALIDTLNADGHAIEHGRGLWRPVPDAAMRHRWSAQLPSAYAHRWHDHHAGELGLRAAWHAVLELPESGWVHAPRFITALLAASGATLHRTEVTAIDAQPHEASLADGSRIRAKHLIWCGGAWGAARLGWPGNFRPGSIVVTRNRLTPCAVSHGLYTAPFCNGAVLGPTSEHSRTAYDHQADASAAVEALVTRSRAMLTEALNIERTWRAVRLTNVTLPKGLHALTAYGSRGFLMAPLAAREYAQRFL